MSDTPNLEQAGGLLEQIDFENYASPFGKVQIELLDDGNVFFEASLPVDILLIGGSDSVDNTYDIEYPLKSHRTFREIRSRLGLSAIDLGDFEDINGSVGMYFDKVPNDAEAWFLILLPLCTRERPMEKVILDMKEAGGLGVAQDIIIDTVGTKIVEITEEDKIKEFKAKIDELHVPHHHSADLVEKMYESPAIRKFVDTLAEMKLAFKESNRSVVVKLISDLPGLQTLANATMRLGRPREQKGEDWRHVWEENPFNLADYEIVMGYTVADIKHPDFVNRYPLKVVRDPRRELSPKDLDKLKLAVVPKYYERDRAEAKRGLWRSVAEAWD